MVETDEVEGCVDWSQLDSERMQTALGGKFRILEAAWHQRQLKSGILGRIYVIVRRADSIEDICAAFLRI